MDNSHNQQLKASQRDETVDFFKGMLMIGVIWGHTITALSAGHFDTSVWIHSFFRIYDMPFFMLLSGFFLKKSLQKYPCKTVIANRIGMILIPILVWSIIRCSFHFQSFYFLWAVFLSSIICSVGYFLDNKTIRHVAIVLYIAVILFLHIIEIPWNIFYLFPFFCVGYYYKDAKFHISNTWGVFLLLTLSIGMCFWQSSYSPWSCGYDAWKTYNAALMIYIYRFILAIMGIYIMANVFKMLYSYIPRRITDFVLAIGKETLALYILQAFVIEAVLNKIMTKVNTSWYSYNPDAIQNLIGYVISPIIAIVTIAILLKVIKQIKNYKWTYWMFGIKLIK